MADFHQNVVPTFTRLVDEDLGRSKRECFGQLSPASPLKYV